MARQELDATKEKIKKNQEEIIKQLNVLKEKKKEIIKKEFVKFVEQI